jgi:ribosomal-protein-alanine acetyltransferase
LPTKSLIRAARPDDVDALLRIEDAAFPGDRLTRRNFRHAVASATIVSLVAEEDGRVAGYVLVETRRTAGVARLSSIAVAPGAAGTGTGRRLADAAEVEVRRRGCDRLRLEVRADNARAIALYEAAGYRRIGRERRYYEDGEAALKFEKTLT